LGVRTTAAVIVAIGDGTGFPTAGHLASYAGLAPATKSSGTSIRGEHAPHPTAATGSSKEPCSRPCSPHRLQSRPVLPELLRPAARARGKTHTQAILRLARQRVNVIHAMIRTGALYEARTPGDVGLAA